MKHPLLIFAALTFIGLAGCGVDDKPIRTSEGQTAADASANTRTVRIGSRLGTSIGGVSSGIGHSF